MLQDTGTIMPSPPNNSPRQSPTTCNHLSHNTNHQLTCKPDGQRRLTTVEIRTTHITWSQRLGRQDNTTMPLPDQENQNLAGRSRRQHRDPQADGQEQAQSKNQRARDLENKNQWTQIEIKPHQRKQAEGDTGSKKQGMKRKNLARKKPKDSWYMCCGMASPLSYHFGSEILIL